MAFFKFQLPGHKRGDDKAAVQPESVEVMRRRARHRLMGAAVLVLVGVIGFPLLFDTQPRPIAVNIPIEIPDKNKVKPLVIPAPPPAARAPAPDGAAAASASSPQVTPPASLDAREELVLSTPEPKSAVAPVKQAQAAIKTEAKPEPHEAPRPEPRAEARRADDSPKAKPLLDGKAATAGADDGRFVVQVGAFSDVAKARETRLKVEKTGLKTYTQVVETRDGKRIRVRVGPFASKADADKAAGKIKGLDLPAAVLTL